MSLEKSIQQLIKKEVQKELEKMMSKHSDVPDSKFDIDELEKGIEVELEHSDSVIIAKAIAKDHLLEDPKYYSNMEKWHDDTDEKPIKEDNNIDVEEKLEKLKNEYYNEIKELFPDEDIEDIDWYDLEKENFIVKNEYYQLIIPSINFNEIYHRDSEADEKIIEKLEDNIQEFIYDKTIYNETYEKIIGKEYILNEIESYNLVEHSEEEEIIINKYSDNGIIENIYEEEEEEITLIKEIKTILENNKNGNNYDISNINLAFSNSLYFDLDLYNKNKYIKHFEFRISNHQKLKTHKTYKKFDLDYIYDIDNEDANDIIREIEQFIYDDTDIHVDLEGR